MRFYYKVDFTTVQELQNLVPEATITLSSRRIVLSFRGSRSATDFLQRLMVDEDLAAAAAAWHYDATLEFDCGRPKLRQHCGMNPDDLAAVTAVLGQQAIGGAST